jgi:peptidase M28-like protein
MYRGMWLALGVPLLLAAFSVSRPAALPAAFPPAFDGASAATLATELARFHPERLPGSPGAIAAAEWFREQLTPYGLNVRTETFAADVPGRGEVEFQNLVAIVRGRTDRRIVVMADRDNLGLGPGADDNASGTAALIVLARSYATPTEREDERFGPAHTIVFLSTDGGALGSVGARHYANTEGGRVDAVINLDTIGGTGSPSLQIAGDRLRSTSPTLVRTAAVRILDQTGSLPRRPSSLRQLIDLAFPYTLYGQGPFVGRGIPAITLTAGGDIPPAPESDVPFAGRFPTQRLGQIGRAAQTLLGSSDEGIETGRGGSPFLYFGPRLVRGWAVQLVLVGALLPFLAAAIDLFARCRRRRIALAPALRSYRSRLVFWAFVGLAFAVFAWLGAWPKGEVIPIPPTSEIAGRWPLGALAGIAVVAAAAWLVVRDRLIPRRPVSREEELAGHTAALLVLALISLLVVATNGFALIFLLPSLHAWIWLPHVRDRPFWVRLPIFVAGFAGPALLLWSFGVRFGFGLDAPAYLMQLAALGYVPLPLLALFLAWLAAAGQLGALAVGRYAPYPDRDERRRFGPFRQLVRAVLLMIVQRRAESRAEEQALGG